jgi:hypothetical protein
MKRIAAVAIFSAFVIGEYVVLSAATVTPAEAVVCARGVVRAGCAGPRGAVVARRPVVRPVVRPVRRAVIIR